MISNITTSAEGGSYMSHITNEIDAWPGGWGCKFQTKSSVFAALSIGQH